MNSNLKLLPAVLLLSVLALAGCGGSSSSDDGDTGPMEPETTCGAGTVLQGNECVPDTTEADAAAAKAMAKKLFGYLGGTGDHVTASAGVGGDRYGTAEAAKAESGMFMTLNTKEFMDTNTDGQIIHVMQYDNKGTGGTEPLDANVEATALGNNANSIMASVFSSNELKEHKVADGVFKARGTYNGAAGEYRCTGTGAGACWSRAATGGGIQLGGSGTWVFDPDAGAMQNMPDTKYATFGWWLDEAITTDGEAKVRTFSYHAGGDPASVDTATGKATYSGIAVGKAALNAARGTDNIGGAFTADATLTANFGASPTLEGKINNFMVGGDARNWEVMLNSQAITGTGGVAASTNSTVWSIDGTKAAAGGGWQAQMYDQADAIGATPHQPSGVTGGFKAVFGADGRMAGAFAAEK